MKKSYIFLFMFLIISISLTLFGCSFGTDVKSIAIISQSQLSQKIEIGQFSYDNYKLKIEYKNGNSEEIELKEDMISKSERIKFFKVGEQSVKVTYKNAECELKITVTRKQLSSITLSDKVATYTGKQITLEVSGVIPANVTVYYPNKNSFTNAGEYDVTAICYGDEYETKELSAKLTIQKATYDMSKVTFENKEYTYDKNPKSIAISGELPSGVNVEYKIGNKQGNSETNAGVYTVTAKFTSTDKNYNSIEDMTATLTINKAKVEGIDAIIENNSVVYSGESYTLEAQINKLPKTVTTNYTIKKIKDAKGNAVDESEQSGNSAINAGTYEIRLNFILSDSVNYESVESLSATLFIDRKEYNLDNVSMLSASFEYDGENHAIELSGQTSTLTKDNINITYTIKRIKNSDGNEVSESEQSGNSAIDVGTYEVTAHFSTSNENYKELKSMTAILEITDKGEGSV